MNLEGPGKVFVIGGVVDSGGVLTSDCEVEFIGDFEMKAGANVELK